MKGFSFRNATRGLLIAATLAFVMPNAPASAQQQPTAEPPAAMVQLGREFIEANGSLRALDNVIPGFLGQVRDMFGTNNPDLIGELNKVTTDLKPEFEAKRNDLVMDIARVYARRFTEAELKELVGFYRSPTGKKFVGITPTVMQESFERMQAWQDKLSTEMVQRVRAEMRKKGHNL